MSPCSVQKELMRHASIQTTMNVYGKAIADSKRQAHNEVVEMVLKGKKSSEATASQNQLAAIGS
jgi:integrase